MKITDVETILLRLPVVQEIGDGCQTICVIRVHTDEGIVGIGDFKSAGRGCLGHKRLGVTVKHMGHGGGLQAVAECDYGQLVTRSD